MRDSVIEFGQPNVIELVQERTGLKQREIAEQIGVTPAQVSKWKAGEHPTRTEELLALAGASWAENAFEAFFFQTRENAERWYQFWNDKGRYINEYDTDLALVDFWKDEPDIYLCMLHRVLRGLGVDLPRVPALEEHVEKALEEIGTTWAITFQVCYVFFDSDQIGESSYGRSMMDFEMELGFLALPLALQRCQPQLRCLGASAEICHTYLSQGYTEAYDTIHEFCRFASELGRPLVRDYFSILSLTYEEMRDMVDLGTMHLSEMDAYMTHAERTILEEVSNLRARVDELLSPRSSLTPSDN